MATRSADSPEIPDEEVDEDRELSMGQAEAILARAEDVRADVDDVLRDLKADARSDPGRLPEDRVDEVDEVAGVLRDLADDLEDLEPDGPEDDDR
jgi:hypothetical protein